MNIKNIVLIVFMILFNVSVYGETPEECLLKHENRLCVFFNPEPVLSEIEDLQIERIAVNRSATKVYIKIPGKEDDVIFEIKEMTRGDDYLMVLLLENGSTMALTEDFELLFLMPDQERMAKFSLNSDYQNVYNRLRK